MEIDTETRKISETRKDGNGEGVEFTEFLATEMMLKTITAHPIQISRLCMARLRIFFFTFDFFSLLFSA